uniref:Tetratricopeptide repeat protein 36 n=1 Tax=Callorhinchus milii TaxID=7868 RepID=A0A4W3HIP3_CALMI|eukprot:gi/632957140/ref/XP_007894311.1/ PREDICTED: tetratricopeptide repeat protein 36 [Callorhinchus milii]
MASLNDQAVLQAIFNPNAPFGDVAGLNLKAEQTDDDSRFEPQLVAQVKALEVEGVSLAEAGNVDGALESFTRAVGILPERASGYNNRAQVLRLKGDTAGALKDLDKAVELSGERGLSAAQALVQRALLHRLAGREPEAESDFRRAAELGSTFARHQVTLLNPFAALCNHMLHKMMSQLRQPEPDSQ